MVYLAVSREGALRGVVSGSCPGKGPLWSIGSACRPCIAPVAVHGGGRTELKSGRQSHWKLLREHSARQALRSALSTVH